jgi:hypothetical protein
MSLFKWSFIDLLQEFYMSPTLCTYSWRHNSSIYWAHNVRTFLPSLPIMGHVAHVTFSFKGTASRDFYLRFYKNVPTRPWLTVKFFFIWDIRDFRKFSLWIRMSGESDLSIAFGEESKICQLPIAAVIIPPCCISTYVLYTAYSTYGW